MSKAPFLAENALCKPTQRASDGDFSPSSTIRVDQAGRIQWSKNDMLDSLEADLDLSRLNAVHDLLWWAGRPFPARPLHQHRMSGRVATITERIDMHLVRTPSAIFLKPMPRILLRYDAWSTHLCTREAVYMSAVGFLLSYVWLVRYDSDLRIAKECGLLPEDITMGAWRGFVASFLNHVDANSLHQVNRRFIYGELRLSRLNQIYRFTPRFGFKHAVFAYALYPQSYGSFLKRSFAWLLVVFVYASIILSAFQVGLATQPTQSSESFKAAAYVVTVFAIVVPVTAAVIASILYLALFTFHVSSARCFEKMRHRERKQALEVRKHRHP